MIYAIIRELGSPAVQYYFTQSNNIGPRFLSITQFPIIRSIEVETDVSKSWRTSFPFVFAKSISDNIYKITNFKFWCFNLIIRISQMNNEMSVNLRYWWLHAAIYCWNFVVLNWKDPCRREHTWKESFFNPNEVNDDSLQFMLVVLIFWSRKFCWFFPWNQNYIFRFLSCRVTILSTSA